MLQLTAQTRDMKQTVASFRKKGLLAGVFYGHKEKSTPVLLDKAEFVKVLREAGESTVVTLKTDNGGVEVLIHEVSFDPVRGEPIHVDFYVPEKGKTVSVEIPLEFVGVSAAVKDLAGTLVKVLHGIEVEALPKDLPHDIKVDISALRDLESQIIASELSLPPGVTLVTDPDEVVAAISVAVEEKEEAGTVDLSAIEVEKKGKKEEAA